MYTCPPYPPHQRIKDGQNFGETDANKLNVRFGSKADIALHPSNVCFILKSRHSFTEPKIWRLNGLNVEIRRPMSPEEFKKYYPRLLGWIDATLKAHAKDTRSVVSRGFSRLPLYFSADTLTSAKVVLVDQLPIPPLSSWGLTRFADFERSTFDGITYLNTFFIKRHDLRNEAIHFHELIHVVQWRILGPEQFIRSYADGLERFGYRASPLEVMAYGAEAAFTQPSRLPRPYLAQR
jgi:hypothetical protein